MIVVRPWGKSVETYATFTTNAAQNERNAQISK